MGREDSHCSPRDDEVQSMGCSLPMRPTLTALHHRVRERCKETLNESKVFIKGSLVSCEHRIVHTLILQWWTTGGRAVQTIWWTQGCWVYNLLHWNHLTSDMVWFGIYNPNFPVSVSQWVKQEQRDILKCKYHANTSVVGKTTGILERYYGGILSAQYPIM